MSDLKCVRHGEVMLVPINEKVKGGEHNMFIVGHSETGHHHILQSKKPFTVSEQDKQFLIELFEPAKLVHKKTVDKHNTLTIAPGKYKVVYKNEYDPFAQLIRRVQD